MAGRALTAPAPGLVSVEEAAELVHRSRRGFELLVRREGIAAYRLKAGQKLWYRRADLEPYAKLERVPA